MRRNTRKKLNVSLLYRSVDRPLVEYMPEQSGENGEIQVYPYNIDQYAMLTPAGLAYSRFTGSAAFDAFCRDNSSWLGDFTLFLALKAQIMELIWEESREAATE